jgi:hypothetical protein
MATLENPFEKVRPKMVAARLELISHLAKFKHDELTFSPAPGEWSALEIAYHTYISDGLALDQLQQVQNEDNPLIPALEEEARQMTRASEPPVSLEAVLGGMAARREELFEYLSSLAPDAWERPLRHPTWGELKFYQMVNLLPPHDQIHARQLADLKTVIAQAQP